MLATQTPELQPEARDVKQIKEKLAQALKALQKRYVTSDTVVTSEDGDANVLCCALEAIFIHGIRSKYVRLDGGAGRGKKGERASLPQPFFWNLLKAVTHRDVVTELEKLSYVGTDVGRCRAWLRLALNDGLLECYMASLFREESKLQAHYQPSALLVDPEEREVLLSYLQGLSSLTFNLSYKSSVLNQWTTTPLALAGLCPAVQADLLNSDDLASSKNASKDAWDTASQSSGSSDAQGGCLAAQPDRGTSALTSARSALNSSNVSLDISGSSHLSSSMSSDSLLLGQDPRCPPGEPWSSGELDISPTISTIARKPLKDTPSTSRESGQYSQDSTREDSFLSNEAPDQFSETANSSGSEIEAPDPVPQLHNPEEEIPNPVVPEQALPSCETNHGDQWQAGAAESQEESEDVEASTDGGPADAIGSEESGELPQKEDDSKRKTSVADLHQGPKPGHSNSIVSRKMSGDSLSYSRSWIAEEDIYKPILHEVPDLDELSSCEISSPTPEANVPPSPPSVVHRRQIGLSNPFRGLLKLGHLERRGTVGMWRDYYCELSPFEFRLYLNAEERTCSENCSLVRCEDARVTSAEGRFELAFSGKRLYLRAANQDEAEDWVDRIVEAVNKCRPAARVDDQWEVLQHPAENGLDEPSLSSTSSGPSSPEQGASRSSEAALPPPLPTPAPADWARTVDLETDAIKEAVLYLSTDPESRAWHPFVFSLSLEALKCFRVQEGAKTLRTSHSIEEIRDVVPDVALGGPAFFKVLTTRETLRLRAESGEEARSWRVLIRGALDSYLESGEDGTVEEPVTIHQVFTGNIQRLVQHTLKGDATLLAHLCTVPTEKGLDTQNFKCAGCQRPIGPSHGKARLCQFSGQFYCGSCHRGNTSIIPARVLHNWDLAPREISRKALQLLAHVEQDPLLNLEQLNPDLVKHSEEMAEVHSLRQRLRLLGDYLLTCRSGFCKKMQARMKQRAYHLEHSHLYSVLDLRQIADGLYAAYLSALVKSASRHVHGCDLCTQRGFICQICHADDIIFPFQFDTTTRCKDCKAVFHLACKAVEHSCPRCLRLRKYLERDLQDSL